MKNRDLSSLKRVSLALCVGVTLYFSSPAQCVNNMSTRFYDTVLTGIGYGNYGISFPKWDPDSGLLASVKINATVSVHYAFTLKNVDLAPSTYSLWVGREDAISSAAMSDAYDNITEQKIGVFPLTPGSSLSEGPFAFLDNYVNTDSITTNTAGFLGSGKVSFVYSPVTYTTLHTNNNSSYSYSSAVQDTVHFSLTYLYCKAGGVLASHLTLFSAVLQDPATVKLDWSVVNEVAGRQYQVQRSQDGQQFTTIASLQAIVDPSGNGQDGGAVQGGTAQSAGGADYTYTDNLPARAAGKWYYRLQINDHTGIAYSVIKQVTVAGNTDGPGLSVYPNPAIDFVDLTFGQGTGSGAGWRVELFATDGSRVLDRNYILTNTIHLNFPHRLPPGVYMLRTTDLQGQQRFINRILIR